MISSLESTGYDVCQTSSLKRVAICILGVGRWLFGEQKELAAVV